MPFSKLKEWLEIEKDRGVEDTYFAVLSTCDNLGTPHSRIVAIREIQTDSLLFFTQKKTRKVNELLNNPKACFNFSLSMQNRQVILEGAATPLSHEDNAAFWATLPHERQLRFTTYAPTSGQVIQNLEQLESKKKELAIQFDGQPIPLCEDYFGFRFVPHTWIFYTVGSITFSEVIRFNLKNHAWQSELLSP